MSSIRLNRLAAADSLPATNVPGFAADLKRLRGKYLSDCNRLRRKVGKAESEKAEKQKPWNCKTRSQQSELSTAAASRRTADCQSATQQTGSLRYPQAHHAHGGLIDDGD